jgi:organic radical activating enzyme
MTQVIQVLDEAHKMGSVEWIFYEGGEPFLFFPLLNESVRRASERGFKVGVVTNATPAVRRSATPFPSTWCRHRSMGRSRIDGGLLPSVSPHGDHSGI